MIMRQNEVSMKKATKTNNQVKKGLFSRLGKIFVIGAVISFLFSLGLNVLSNQLGIYINVSSSLPYGFYKAEYRKGVHPGLFSIEGINDFDYKMLIDPVNTSLDAVSKGDEHGIALAKDFIRNTLKVERGDVVLFCLNSQLARFAYDRGYIASGKCPGGFAPLGKHVVAVNGDEIEVKERGVFINGQFIAFSKIAEFDGQNRVMPMYAEPGSKFTLEAGELYFLNPKADSFDSRYFGPIKSFYVIAKLKPLWTF